MIPAGYLYKKIALKPDGLNAEGVDDVYSLSSCISPNFADYIPFWKHNGYWLFDSPEIIEELAQSENIDLSTLSLFYYEVYEQEYDAVSRQWSTFSAESSFPTAVVIPPYKALAGFDVVTFACGNAPECSPLSCNALASGIAVNRHCLFRTFDEALHCLENGCFAHAEPGRLRIFAVYTL